MKNPFRYGIAVDEPYFIDREEEMKDFTKWLKSGQSLVIYSPRRYGKTSLILKLLKNLSNEGYNTVYVDFFKVNSRRRFAELYFAGLMKQMSSWEKALRKISTITKKVRPVVSLDNQGLPTISVRFDDNEGAADMTEIFDLPQNLAGTKPWIVVFDEFQEVERLNGGSFEMEMRAALIHHNKVSYVFMGSKTTMLLNMFTNKSRAFYQFGKIIELKKIASEIMARYIDNGFKNTKISLQKGFSEKITEICEEIPHYIQYLASGTWEEAMENNKTADDMVLERAVDKIINNQGDFFMRQYEILTSHQQRVLVAVCEENRNVFTSDFAERFHLTPISSTQRSLEKLLKEGILSKSGDTYNFNDPFFRLWLKKRIL